MYNYYLRANSFNEINSALQSAGLLVDHDFGNGKKIFLLKRGIELEHIGEHIKEDSKMDENGEIIQEAIIDKRWHTNIRTSEPLSEEQKNILPLMNPPPSTPSCIFG